MTTDKFKAWLVEVAGYDLSEANDLCVSGYEADVKRCEALYARFEQFIREERLKQLPFDAGFGQCVEFIAKHGLLLGVANPIVEWAEDAFRLIDGHNPSLSNLNRGAEQ